MSKKITQEEFLKKAQEKHGDKYDYSKTDVNNRNEKGEVCITCHELDVFGNIHGDFWQIPSKHTNNQHATGCPKCAGKNRTLEELKIMIQKLHGDKYVLSGITEYINNEQIIYPFCKKHGEFQIKIKKILENRGCPMCAGRNKTTQQYIEECRNVHGNKYIYDKIDYIDSKHIITPICPKHGIFKIKASKFLEGHGCKKCAIELSILHKSYSNEELIKIGKKLYGDKYDYSLLDNFNKDDKGRLKIICKEHGEFRKTVYEFINGKACRFCNDSLESKLEKKVRLFLEEHNIRFKQYYKTIWLGLQSLDFYLPDYNIAIECQGSQHYIPFGYFGGEKKFEENKERDARKLNKCVKNGVKVIYFTEPKFSKYDHNAYTDMELLYNEMLK